MNRLVQQLRGLSRWEHGDVSIGDEAADEIERLRAALRPFAGLFLWPDDLGEDAAANIRSDPDWDSVENDSSKEEIFISRGCIRAARAALKP
jgi:hypothetical protein